MKEVLNKVELFEKRINEVERNRMEKYYTQVAALDLELRDLKKLNAETSARLDLLTCNLVAPILEDGISMVPIGTGNISVSQLSGALLNQTQVIGYMNES